MGDIPPHRRDAVSFAFDRDVWAQEVERFPDRSRPRAVAVGARNKLERSGAAGHRVQRCASEGDDGSRLGACVKMYLPLDGASSADAPYGFVFELGVDDGPPLRLELVLLAFGERHPAPGTRNVYERAHKRLHGRYPDQ